jgi:hypothetical protein
MRRIKGERFRVNEFAGLQDLTPALTLETTVMALFAVSRAAALSCELLSGILFLAIAISC